MPKLSNDPRVTAKVELIRDHYEAIREDLTWSTERYKRLCSAFGITPYELGAMVRASIKEVEHWLAKNSFPKAVELHLTMMERIAYRDFHKEPIFPPCFSTLKS